MGENKNLVRGLLLGSQNFQSQMFFPSNNLGKLILDTFFQHEVFVKNVFKVLQAVFLLFAFSAFCFSQFFKYFQEIGGVFLNCYLADPRLNLGCY